MFIRFDVIHERDRQTDTGWQQRSRLCIASRGINVTTEMCVKTAIKESNRLTSLVYNHATSWENGSCCHYSQWLWDDDIKFARWQQLAMACRARFAVADNTCSEQWRNFSKSSVVDPSPSISSCPPSPPSHPLPLRSRLPKYS